MKVAVIVDDLDPLRRRRCFWDEQLSRFPDVDYELVSLMQKMEERRFFDVYRYDLIIFNWCVLDGALMYQSDRVQNIVRFYDDHFIQFVRKGGVLIMENQPKRWRPSQEAYDTLLPGEFSVTAREPYLFANTVNVNPRLRKHPLVQHLHSVLHTAYEYPATVSWFPPDSTSKRSMEELHPKKLYSGGFHRWKSDWLPLLYTEDDAHAVMLVKTEGLGIWIISTMFLASSNMHELLESLIYGSQRHALAIRAFHKEEGSRRRRGLLGVGAIFAGLAVAVYYLVASRAVFGDVPQGSTVLGNIVFSLLLTAAISALTFLRRYIGRALRAAFNR